jgi:methionyl-tRNA formyltransferase
MFEVGEFGKGVKIKRVLFLGYDRSETRLIDKISDRGIEVIHSNEALESLEDFDLVICFGYRHIISSKVLDVSPCRLVNLHISMLPWNRGAHPIFWAFFDGTPLGVSIHEIDRGLDTGALVSQKEIFIDAGFLTFEDVHIRMIREVEDLFMATFDEILEGTYKVSPQIGGGSSHKASDLPPEFSGWESGIHEEIIRLKSLKNCPS